MLVVFVENIDLFFCSGMWSCHLCIRESELKIEAALPRPVESTGSKRKMSMERLLEREMKVCGRLMLFSDISEDRVKKYQGFLSRKYRIKRYLMVNKSSNKH